MAMYDELKQLADLRLKEAETLFAAGLFDGARYLSGYVVELALKARICRLLDVDEYPPAGREVAKAYLIHDLDQLLLLAGLKRLKSLNPTVFANWNIAVKWGPEKRYDAVGSVTKQDAEDTLNAIRDANDGVFTWIKTYW